MTDISGAMEAARRLLAQEWQTRDDRYNAPSSLKDGCIVARAFISSHPHCDGEGNRGLDAAASPVDPWQPLPEDRTDDCEAFNGDSVLVTGVSAGPFVCEAWYDAEHEGWWLAQCHPTDAVDGQIIGVTHWKPLPAPPGADANQQSKTGGAQASDSLARISNYVNESSAVGERIEKVGRALLSSHPEDGGIREELEKARAFFTVEYDADGRAMSISHDNGALSALIETLDAALNPAPLPIGEERGEKN